MYSGTILLRVRTYVCTSTIPPMCLCSKYPTTVHMLSSHVFFVCLYTHTHPPPPHTHTHTHPTHTHMHIHAHTHTHSGRVWSLQHLCRITIRRNLGVRKRRRIKELPLPKPVLSFLCALPVEKSKELHQNWDRARSSKAEAVRKRGEAKRPKPTRYSPGMHTYRTQNDAGFLNC